MRCLVVARAGRFASPRHSGDVLRHSGESRNPDDPGFPRSRGKCPGPAPYPDTGDKGGAKEVTALPTAPLDSGFRRNDVG